MTVSVREEREALMDLLTDAAGDLVAAVTIDAQEARPLPGKAVMLIDRRRSRSRATSSKSASGL